MKKNSTFIVLQKQYEEAVLYSFSVFAFISFQR